MKFSGQILLLSFLCLLAFPQRGIRITNYKFREVVRYPVVLLKGEVSDTNASEIVVVNKSSHKNTRIMNGVVHKGRFKVLAELVPGENELVLRSGSSRLNFKLTYKPQTNPYYVRIIYFTDSSGDTRYQTQFPDDPQDYKGKLDTMAKLLQTFTAEKLHDLGFPRKTFNLEFDENGDVVVHILKGSKSKEEYWKMEGGEIYGEIYNEIERQMPDPYAKNLVVPAFTYFDPSAKKVYAHLALGGGNLAVMGGIDLFTWPNNLKEVQRTFMDATPIDTSKVFSDSVWRDTVWACASTTMGAALHELGHTFGLPHSTDPYDIMSRGFDYFTRVFTLVEPPHARRSEAYEFKEEEEAHWAPINVEAMLAGRWFALDKREWKDERAMDVYIDRDKLALIAHSDYGVKFLGFDYKGESNFYVPLFKDSLNKEVLVPLRELGRKIGSIKDVGIRIFDGEGNDFYYALEGLLVGPCVQSWQFASQTIEWQDYNSFPFLSEEKLREIEKSASSSPLIRFASPIIDFTRVFKTKNEHIAGYAFRGIFSDSPRKIRILTGSDDALRIWLNGRLVKEVLALRGVRPDEDSTEVELQKGENRLLVEVDNWEGGWGLILRFEDESGKKLLLNDDGKLVAWDESKDRAIHSLLIGPWVRKWRFSKITKEWKDKSSLPEISKEDIEAIISSALSQPLTEINPGDAFVDFAKYYSELGKTTDIAGYVLREINCDEPMKLRIFAGSDDALRIWVNGELVKEVLALRGARRDQDTCIAQLRKGRNLLLVEVANGGGDWGLFLRLEDDKGNDLFLSDEGKLEKL